MKLRVSIEIIIACLIGMFVASIFYYATVSRMEDKIEEIHRTQLVNSDRARTDRWRLENKIDSFIIINQQQK